MTSHVVLVDPPRPGLVLRELVETGTLSLAEAATVYRGLIKDLFRNVVESGGGLTVFVRPAELLPPEYRNETEAVAEVRALGVGVLADPDVVTYREQTGQTRAERTANAIEWAVETTEDTTVAVLDVRAPMLFRSVLDQAAMQLRRHDVVVAPSPDGQAAYLGLTEPLDVAGNDAPLALEALVTEAMRADLSVGFLPVQPVVRSVRDLEGLASILRARATADQIVPTHTVEAIRRLEVLGEPGEVG